MSLQKELENKVFEFANIFETKSNDVSIAERELQEASLENSDNFVILKARQKFELATSQCILAAKNLNSAAAERAKRRY
jgi:hypothetical protein